MGRLFGVPFKPSQKGPLAQNETRAGRAPDAWGRGLIFWVPCRPPKRSKTQMHLGTPEFGLAGSGHDRRGGCRRQVWSVLLRLLAVTFLEAAHFGVAFIKGKPPILEVETSGGGPEYVSVGRAGGYAPEP